MKRRLAAILAADVVGYSRLMGEDEAGTLERLTTLREQVLEPLIAEHHGRVVKLMGDGILVEFASVVDAVVCAVAWQERVAEREAERNENSRLRFRIGINVGDVIVEGGDIHGDGVNIAARLEGLAEPDGICLSGDAYRQVRGKIEAQFEDLGEREVKNLAEPLRVYRVATERLPTAGTSPATKPLPLPDKPSIAVLPFDNMSGDPEQEYFSDGITEDIITELSRFRSLFVIARKSSFAFKGQAVDVGEIGRKLGVHYVVEGSVRKAGNRVRITAQLVEAASGNHLWAERYDRELEDIFAVQDEVVREIAVAVPGQLDVAAIQRVQRRPTENLTAYDLVLRGEHLKYQDWSSREANALFEKAIEIDPQCARAHSHLANWHAYSILLQLAPADEARGLTRSFAERAAQIAPNDPVIQAMLSDTYLMVGDPDMARRCIERAIKLNPNDYMVMFYAGVVLAYVGDIDEGLKWIEKLVRHDPLSIEAHREASFEAYYLARRYEDAIDRIKGWRDPPPQLLIGIAAAYAQLGRMDEAQEARRHYENHLPQGYNFNDLLAARLRICAHQKDRDNWIEGLRKAGFDL